MRLLACWLLGVGMATGQTAKRAPAPLPVVGESAVPAAAVVVLRGMAERAGVIFAGHVLAVERHDTAGYVDVVFAVDEAVKGCADDKPYVLREWAGLWAEEPRRYGVGQRLLMMLAARGPSGMSAPVGGMAGRIPLVGMRQAPVARGGVGPADSGDLAEEAVDLRWVEAAGARTAVGGMKARAEAAKAAGWVGPAAPMQRKATAGVGLSAVLAVLGGN